MARISIQDLPYSEALDHQALRVIAGGSRNGVRPLELPQTQNARPGQCRVVDYPPGFGRRQRAAAGSAR